MEFKEYKLGELIYSISETHRNGENKVILINTSDILDGKVLNHEYVENKNLKGQFKKKFKKFDILYSEIRPQNKRFAFVDFESDNYIASTKLMVIRKKSNLINNLYLFQFLKMNKTLDYLQMIAESRSGTFPQITFSDLSNIDIKLPSIKIQEKVAKILYNIDSKIELNNKINDNLLEIIKVNYENYINECNNSEYEEYDAIELLDFISGVEPGSANYSDKLKEGYIKFYRVGDMNSECKNYVSKDLLKNKIAAKDDILVSFDGTIGRIAYGISGGFSTGMRNIKSKNNTIYKLSSAFILAYFTNKENINILQENARGTTILHASSAIEHFKIKINKDTINEFMKLIDSLFEKIKLNKLENENLTQIRDILLPKLMNGEIDLENIEI